MINEVIMRTDEIILDDRAKFCLNQSLTAMEYDKDAVYPKYGLIHYCIFETSNDNEADFLWCA